MVIIWTHDRQFLSLILNVLIFDSDNFKRCMFEIYAPKSIGVQKKYFINKYVFFLKSLMLIIFLETLRLIKKNFNYN